jgi:hypothetical protein
MGVRVRPDSQIEQHRPCPELHPDRVPRLEPTKLGAAIVRLVCLGGLAEIVQRDATRAP